MNEFIYSIFINTFYYQLMQNCIKMVFVTYIFCKSFMNDLSKGSPNKLFIKIRNFRLVTWRATNGQVKNSAPAFSVKSVNYGGTSEILFIPVC